MSSVHFNFKRCISSLLVIVTISACAFITAPYKTSVKAATPTVDDYKSYIAQLEQEQSEIQAEINSLKSDKNATQKVKNAIQRKIDNLQSQINACNRQINDCDTKIDQLENAIINKNNELEETKYVFRQRLRAIYMSGGSSISSIALILSAENLDELLSKSELAKSVSAFDSALMDKIIEDVKIIEESKVQIAKLSDEQEAVKKTLDSKKGELMTEMKAVNADLSQIGGNISNLQSQANAIDKAIQEYEQSIRDALDVGSDQTHDGQFMWPVPGYRSISSPYGWRKDPFTGKSKFHKGIDIAGSGIKGKPIVAAADGTVSLADYNKGGYGYYVMVNHGEDSKGDKYVTLYAHMTKYIVSVGQTVKKGQTIGYVGTTGASTGYHLHFEIRINGETTNPTNYF